MSNYKINREDVEITEEGKVVISSEELANAILGTEVNLNAEEEAEGNFICVPIVIS